MSLIGCKEQLDKSTETILFTQDSLYKITFEKPLELDTFYSWKDEDDNVCSDEHKYRFYKKHFPVQKETGFFWTSFADSTYRLTIKHVEKYDCKLGMDHENWSTRSEYMQRILKRAKSDLEQIDTLFSDSTEINGNNYILCAYKLNEHYKNEYKTNYIKAITNIDSNLIVFTADCRARDCNDFIDRMNKSIRTIRIKRTK